MAKDSMSRDSAYADINLEALLHNVKVIKTKYSDSKMIAVIKANAYGHGIVTIAQTLQKDQSVYGIGVARLTEALELRQAGIQLPILLLEGFFNGSDIPLLIQHNLQTAIHSQEQLQAVLECESKEKLTVWLKFDTGMHRLGFHPQEFANVLAQLNQCNAIQLPINMMTHFHCADELDNPRTKQQIALFKQQISQQIGLCSLANSAAVLAWPQAHADMIRPGIALYGISPFPDKQGTDHQLQPVMTLKSRLIAVRQHAKDETVGYGEHWLATEDTVLGVIAIGYGDGYPRTAPSGTPVLINGRIVPIVGRVSMDMITVNLGKKCIDKVGDLVTLWGEGLPAEVVAEHIGTIGYELVTRLTTRVPLIYR